MKTMNQLISDYTSCLRQGEIQIAYKAIMEFMNRLRSHYIKKHPDYDTGSVYQGFMDMTYYSLGTKPLKDKGLKIAVVYLHEKGVFEVWLSARNREIAKQYESIGINTSSDILLFHDAGNQDAIVECTLTSAPDFEDQASLINIIEQNVQKFVAETANLLALTSL